MDLAAVCALFPGCAAAPPSPRLRVPGELLRALEDADCKRAGLAAKEVRTQSPHFGRRH